GSRNVLAVACSRLERPLPDGSDGFFRQRCYVTHNAYALNLSRGTDVQRKQNRTFGNRRRRIHGGRDSPRERRRIPPRGPLEMHFGWTERIDAALPEHQYYRDR